MAKPLPSEVWSKVVRILKADLPYPEYLRTVIRLSSVGHQISDEISPIIYAAPRIPVCSYTAFFQCMATSPRLCGLVRALRVFPPKQEPEAFDAKSNERQIVDRYWSDVLQSLKMMPQLTDLDIHTGEWRVVTNARQGWEPGPEINPVHHEKEWFEPAVTQEEWLKINQFSEKGDSEKGTGTPSNFLPALKRLSCSLPFARLVMSGVYATTRQLEELELRVGDGPVSDDLSTRWAGTIVRDIGMVLSRVERLQLSGNSKRTVASAIDVVLYLRSAKVLELTYIVDSDGLLLKAIPLVKGLEELRIMNFIHDLKDPVFLPKASTLARSLLDGSPNLKIVDIYVNNAGTYRWQKGVEKEELVVLTRMVGADMGSVCA